MSDTSTSGDTGQARSEPCIREGATPAGLHDPDDPQPDTLIIDCRAHGEIGRVSFGPCEFERAEALFAEHVADTGQAREPRPVYPQVWCDDSSGPNGIGGTCVLGPGHLHRDGLGGEWPFEQPGDTVQAPDEAATALRDAARLLDMVADARDDYLDGMKEDSESAAAIENFGSGIRSAARILRSAPHEVELLVPTWRYLGELAELDAQVRALLGTDTTPEGKR